MILNNGDKLGLEKVHNLRVYHIQVCKTGSLLINKKKYFTSYFGKRNFGAQNYKASIESIVEDQRQKLHDDKPSRATCLFVCDSNHAQYWYNYFEKRNPGRTIKILELDVTGKIFWSYAELLRLENYWEPDYFNEFQEHEGLFEGEFEVIKECDKMIFANKRVYR